MLVTVMQSFKMFITSLWGTLYQLCGEDDYVIGVYGEVIEVIVVPYASELIVWFICTLSGFLISSIAQRFCF